MLPESVLEEVGGLDPGAIAQVREEAWPDVRDADELHDVLHTLVALPEDFSAWGQPPSPAQSSAARPVFAPADLSEVIGKSDSAGLSWTAEDASPHMDFARGQWSAYF
jgi:hypothetical protein